MLLLLENYLSLFWNTLSSALFAGNVAWSEHPSTVFRMRYRIHTAYPYIINKQFWLLTLYRGQAVVISLFMSAIIKEFQFTPGCYYFQAQARNKEVKKLPEQVILSEVRRMVEEMQGLNQLLEETVCI
jgi:hypothetical protein